MEGSNMAVLCHQHFDKAGSAPLPSSHWWQTLGIRLYQPADSDSVCKCLTSWAMCYWQGTHPSLTISVGLALATPFEHICQTRRAGELEKARTIPALTCASLKPCSPRSQWSDTAALWGGPVLAHLLCWGNPARWWSHYGLCPHNAKKPSQAINNSSSEGVPWSGHLCAGHGNMISRFVLGRSTRGARGGSWTCVTCCWQLGASMMCRGDAGGGDVEEGPLFQWLVCLDSSFFIVSPVQSVILFLRMCLKSPVLWGRQLSCQWRMVGEMLWGRDVGLCGCLLSRERHQLGQRGTKAALELLF